MPRNRRHQPLRIAVSLTGCLMLGAATTLAFAWGIASRGIQLHPISWTVQSAYSTNGSAWVFLPGQFGFGYSALRTSRMRAFREAPGIVTRPSVFDSGFQGYKRVKSIPNHRHLPTGEADHRFELQFGWPFRSMWNAHDTKIDVDIVSMYQNVNTWSIRKDGTGDLPTGIIPSGATLDTLIFATAYWTLLFCWRHARTWHRRRRHLCPHCAYDLRATPPASPCPECGRAAPRRYNPSPAPPDPPL